MIANMVKEELLQQAGAAESPADVLEALDESFFYLSHPRNCHRISIID